MIRPGQIVRQLRAVPVKGAYGYGVDRPAGPVGRPVQCSPGYPEGGLGYPDAFGCGPGDCPGPGAQDGPAGRWPRDRSGPGLKFGVGVTWPAGAGLVEWCGPRAG